MPSPAHSWCSSKRAVTCRPTRSPTSTFRFSNPSSLATLRNLEHPRNFRGRSRSVVRSRIPSGLMEDMPHHLPRTRRLLGGVLLSLISTAALSDSPPERLPMVLEAAKTELARSMEQLKQQEIAPY